MSMKNSIKFDRDFNRLALKTIVQSLFWSVIQSKKSEGRFTLQSIADHLHVHKSTISKDFSEPRNWSIEKISDLAHALDIKISVLATDGTGRTFGPSGCIRVAEAVSSANDSFKEELSAKKAVSSEHVIGDGGRHNLAVAQSSSYIAVS